MDHSNRTPEQIAAHGRMVKEKLKDIKLNYFYKTLEPNLVGRDWTCGDIHV